LEGTSGADVLRACYYILFLLSPNIIILQTSKRRPREAKIPTNRNVTPISPTKIIDLSTQNNFPVLLVNQSDLDLTASTILYTPSGFNIPCDRAYWLQAKDILRLASFLTPTSL